MKVLVIDDESSKLKSIMKVIKNIEGIDVQKDVDITLQLNEAKQKLLETRYDLMILDLNMPEELGSDPDKDGGTNFIEEIIYIDTYKKPRDIIILTAYDELEQKVKSNEKLCGFYILKYSETSTEWSEHIKKRIEYILTCENNEESEEIRADVALITAVRTESEAVKKVYKKLEKVNIKNDPTIYYKIQAENNITIITAQQTEMGMASAATLSTKMIEHFKPKYLIMVGIAAGIGKDKNLGDIIIPSEVWNYSSGKYVESKNGQEAILSFLPDPVSIPLETTIREIVSQDFKERLFKIKNEADGAPDNDLKVVIGPMACGAAVVANKDIVEELIKKHHRKTVGLDMESYGIFFAAKNAVVAGTIPICVKSICDFADVNKDDSAQKYAALTSTLFVKKLIEEDLEF